MGKEHTPQIALNGLRVFLTAALGANIWSHLGSALAGAPSQGWDIYYIVLYAVIIVYCEVIGARARRASPPEPSSKEEPRPTGPEPLFFGLREQ